MSEKSEEKDEIISIGSAIFLFYLLLSSNFLDTLYGCRTQDLFLNNMLFKHFVGLFTLFSSVVYTQGSKYSPVYALGISIFLYILFIFTARCDRKFFALVLLCIFSAFVLGKINTYYYKEKTTEQELVKKTQKGLYITAMIFTLIGFLSYLGQKKIQYKEDFKYSTFFIGKPSCNFEADDIIYKNYSYIDFFKKAFS